MPERPGMCEVCGRQYSVVTEREQRGKVWVCIPALLTGCAALGRLLNPEALISSFNGKTNKKARGIIAADDLVSEAPCANLAHLITFQSELSYPLQKES